MRIGIIGTGVVGRTLAEGFDRAGHDVVIGTRDPVSTRDRIDEGQSYGSWNAMHPGVGLATFAEAAAGAEVVVNAANGLKTLEILGHAGAENLAGKPLIDTSNSLDFSNGFPPAMGVTDALSLAEQVQAAFPDARVVKTLNTMAAAVMIAPDIVGDGDHTIFLSGDDEGAKATVAGLLGELGWTDILDLGDITTARGPEMLLPLWMRTLSAVGGTFQIKIVR